MTKVHVSFFSVSVDVNIEDMAKNFVTLDDEEFDVHFSQYIEDKVFQNDIEIEIDFFDTEKVRHQYMKLIANKDKNT